MPPIGRQVLAQHIASGATAPLYLIEGDDEAEKSMLVAQFVEMVDEGIRAFNVDHVSGDEDKAAQRMIDAAATLPMMASRRIVIVHRAERLLIPKREGEAADAEQARLEAFVADPPPHATVVFATTALDRRRRLIKQLVKEAQHVECGSMIAVADAQAWIRVKAEREKVPLDASAMRALVDRTRLEATRDLPVRVDLVRLRAAFERVALYALGQAAITGEDVAQVVSLTAEARHFGIANAIERGSAAEALRELALALEDAAPPMVLGQLRWIAEEKVPSARKPGAIDAVFRTDLALKSSALDSSLLLERLVVELCAMVGTTSASVSRTSRR